MLRKSIISREREGLYNHLVEQVVKATEKQKKYIEYHEILRDEDVSDPSELTRRKSVTRGKRSDSVTEELIEVIRRSSNTVLGTGNTNDSIKKDGSNKSNKHKSSILSNLLHPHQHHNNTIGSPSNEGVELQRPRLKSLESETNVDEITPIIPAPMTWANALLDDLGANKKNRFSFHTREKRTEKNDELIELDAVANNNWLTAWLLSFFMKQLDDILKEPVAYLCKQPNPVSLHLALEYLTDNELTNNIVILHFVDDREVMKAHKQFMKGIQTEIHSGRIPVTDEEKYSIAFLNQAFMNTNNNAVDLQTFLLQADSTNVNLIKAMECLPSNVKKMSDGAKLMDTYFRYDISPIVCSYVALE